MLNKNKDNKYINIVLPIVILLLFCLFNFIYNSIKIAAETNQNDFVYTIKIRDTIEEIDKVVERAQVNLNVLADDINIMYDVNNLHNEKYNIEFIHRFNGLTEAALINIPGVDGVWFQLNNKLPFSTKCYTWYRMINGKSVNLMPELAYPSRKLNPENDSYYFEAVKNKDTTWSDIYEDFDIHVKMLTISKPVFKNGKLIGVVGVDISVQNLQQALTRMQNVFKNSDIFLIDRNDLTILYKLNKGEVYSEIRHNFDELLKLKIENKDAVIGYYDKGVEKTAILLTLSNKYNLVITFPDDIILNGFGQLFKTVYFIFFVMTILAIITFLNLKKIKKINTELDVRTKKLQTIFESTPNIIVVKDLDGLYIYCNQKFSTSLNLKKEDLIGKNAYDLFTKESADEITQMENVVKKTGKMVSYESLYNVEGNELYTKKYIIPLKDSMDDIHEILIIATDITKSKEEEKFLIDAKENAEKTALIKSNFIANMSHEMRTPLNGVIGFIQLLKETKLTNEQEEFVSDAQKSSEILLNLINDILDLSKIEADKLELENISFDVRALVEDITAVSTATAEKKGIEISSLICSDVPLHVFGDPGRVRQILNNFLSNSIKFTSKGEIVIYVKQISADKKNTLISFEVKDTGIGIAEDNLKLIFEEFSQADASMTRKFGGTGLGLAITQRLVKLMNGNIEVKSKLGEGSTFTVKIPFKKDKSSNIKSFNSIKSLNGAKILLIDDNPTDIRIINHYLGETNCVIYEAKTCEDAKDILNRESFDISVIIVNHKMHTECNSDDSLYENNQNFNDIPIILYSSMAKRGDSIWAKKKGFRGYLTKPIKKNELIEAIEVVINNEDSTIQNHKLITKHFIKENKFLDKVKILIAEDNEINCKLINKIFENRGFHYDFAYNGQEAIDAIKLRDYDLILMDCQMPIMDGYEATIKIRELEGAHKQHTPIIAMTANAMATDKEKCHQIGMDDYISKPINVDNLFELIKKYVQIDTDKTNSENDITIIVDKIVFELGLSNEDALQLLKEYTEIIPNTVLLLKKACDKNDIETMKEITHKLKGSSSNLRIEKIVQFILDLEQELNEDKGQDSYRKIIIEIENYLEYLKNLLN